MMYKTPFNTKSQLLNELESAKLSTDKILLAVQYAERAHSNQKRDFGVPYLEEHIYPMALGIIGRYKGDSQLENILILGLLHDVLEDDPSASPGEIEQNFGREILQDLRFLTKPPQDNDNLLSEGQKRLINVKMLERLKDASRPAQIVKLEDRLNNLSSFPGENTDKCRRYISEVKEIFIPFARKFVPGYVELFYAQLERLAGRGVKLVN